MYTVPIAFKQLRPWEVCSLNDPWSFAASNSLMHFYTLMYLEVITVLHYDNYDGNIHACVLKSCISSKYNKCIRAIKRMLSTTTNVYTSSSYMYLCISLYCDACLQSSALRVGVKTLHNAISISVCTVSYEALCVMVTTLWCCWSSAIEFFEECYSKK